MDIKKQARGGGVCRGLQKKPIVLHWDVLFISQKSLVVLREQGISSRPLDCEEQGALSHRHSITTTLRKGGGGDHKRGLGLMSELPTKRWRTLLDVPKLHRTVDIHLLKGG